MLIEMKVSQLTVDPVTSMPILILKDLAATRALPIWIGLGEASAIIAELQQIKLSRPLTHDLMKRLIDELDGRVVRVEIRELVDDTYLAAIVIEQGGRERALDARPSDAVALALRVGTSILVDEEVIAKAGELRLSLQGIVQSPAAARDLLACLPEECFGKWKM